MILLQLMIYLYNLDCGKIKFEEEKHFTQTPFYGSVDNRLMATQIILHITRLRRLQNGCWQICALVY